MPYLLHLPLLPLLTLRGASFPFLSLPGLLVLGVVPAVLPDIELSMRGANGVLVGSPPEDDLIPLAALRTGVDDNGNHQDHDVDHDQNGQNL